MSTLHCVRIARAGRWPGGDAVDRVRLTYDDRYRRRSRLVGVDQGLDILVNLPDAVVLADGDALILSDGSLVAVEAQPEPVIDIAGRDARHTAQLAWHLGNRHCPTQILATDLRIRADHVLADMLRGLGATVTERHAPFTPEGGAYSHHHEHSHAHQGETTATAGHNR